MGQVAEKSFLFKLKLPDHCSFRAKNKLIGFLFYMAGLFALACQWRWLSLIWKFTWKDSVWKGMHLCVLHWEIWLHSRARCLAHWGLQCEECRHPLLPGPRWWDWCLQELRQMKTNSMLYVLLKIRWVNFKIYSNTVWSIFIETTSDALYFSRSNYPICNRVHPSKSIDCDGKLTGEVGHVCALIHHTLHEVYRLPM